jgi:hypothetical protein
MCIRDRIISHLSIHYGRDGIMSSKDESIFDKSSLMHTEAGRDILKQATLKNERYKQFMEYKELADAQFPRFIDTLVNELHSAIRSDDNPIRSMDSFLREVEFDGFTLDKPFILTRDRLDDARARLADKNVCKDRVLRLLDSNYVKMTYPVFYALFDASCSYHNVSVDEGLRDTLIDGHIIAIDLSEPMDRIMDMDEDIAYLDDYRLICPYMLSIARRKISSISKDITESFEQGFKEARRGQYMDMLLKKNPLFIDEESMNECYKKYRAVMGTAARNMVLVGESPLRNIFYHGMAKAGESVGCGNEIEDSIRLKVIKVPSWPLYYALNGGDVRLAFDLTFKKSTLYLDDAMLAIHMLPSRFKVKPFLEFMVLSVKHYNEYWYRKARDYDLNVFTSALKAR